MTIFQKYKGHFFLGLLISLVIVATPLIAGVIPNIFTPDSTISSSEMNENFTHVDGRIDQVQDRVNNLCNVPGQVAVAAEVDADGNLVGNAYSCNGDAVISSSDGVGFYFVEVENLDLRNFFTFVQAESEFPGHVARYCTLRIVQNLSSNWVARVICFEESVAQTDPEIATPFFITMIRKP